jgi:hypothetical protein
MPLENALSIIVLSLLSFIRRLESKSDLLRSQTEHFSLDQNPQYTAANFDRLLISRSRFVDFLLRFLPQSRFALHCHSL